MMIIQEILSKYFGYNKFRPNQKKIINYIIDKKNVLAILPTGGGKSICYQIPALINDGICIVISPLLALIDDQISLLKSRGIKSISISGNLTNIEIDSLLNTCIYSNVKFLYVSPERIRSELVRNKIALMNVNLIAIDEAHCISEWGHDFRPAYRNISLIKKITNDPPILALTATATQSVIDDIKENLEINDSVVVKGSLKRKNLCYMVERNLDKKQRLIEIVNKVKSSVIVYCYSRKNTEIISDLLIKNNYSSAFYHAGMSSKKRDIVQEKWFKNEIRILVATSAFGMGINKTDIKLIIHMDAPLSIESYFQESGRAGRAGQKSYSYLLINDNDFNDRYNLINLKYPSVEILKSIYQNIANFFQVAENEMPDHPLSLDMKIFSERYKLSPITLFYSLQYFEIEGLISVSHITKPVSKVKILLTNNELYKYQISNKYFDKFFKIILRQYPNILNEYVIINERKIASLNEISANEVEKILERLQQIEILTYMKKNDNPKLKFIEPRKDTKHLHFKIEDRDNRKKREINKLIKFQKYVNQKKCREQMLLNYFGEVSESQCGRCDICRNFN